VHPAKAGVLSREWAGTHDRKGGQQGTQSRPNLARSSRPYGGVTVVVWALTENLL